MKTFRLSVWPQTRDLRQPGISRSAPSAKPMYQSGWAPAVTGDGSYGPYTQIGLIVTTAAMQRDDAEDDEEEAAGLGHVDRQQRVADDVVVGPARARGTGCACGTTTSIRWRGEQAER